jgi:uncharacterized protein YgiB involved in biofilm formation
MRALLSLAVGAAAALACSSSLATAQDAAAAKRPRLAFVTNCVAEFWTVGTFGVEAA